MSAFELIEERGDWVVSCAGCTVTQCCVDFGFTVIISDGTDSIEVRIEEPFDLRLTGESQRVDPEGDPTALAPALGVLRRPVARAVAFHDGRLEVSFADGGELAVPSSDDYEPWTLVGPAGLRLVSMPGGELAIWKPDSA